MKTKAKNDFLQPILLMAVAGLLLVTGIFWFAQNPGRTNENQLKNNRYAEPFLEINVREIASKFYCVCGKCKGESLEICTCEQAVKERLEIKENLQKGLSQEKIITLINNTYGGQKNKL